MGPDYLWTSQVHLYWLPWYIVPACVYRREYQCIWVSVCAFSSSIQVKRYLSTFPLKYLSQGAGTWVVSTSLRACTWAQVQRFNIFFAKITAACFESVFEGQDIARYLHTTSIHYNAWPPVIWGLCILIEGYWTGNIITVDHQRIALIATGWMSWMGSTWRVKRTIALGVSCMDSTLEPPSGCW